MPGRSKRYGRRHFRGDGVLDAGILVMSGAQRRVSPRVGSPRSARALAPGQARRCHERMLECLLATHPDSTSVASCTTPRPQDALKFVTRLRRRMQPAKPQCRSSSGAASHWARTLEYERCWSEEKTGGVQRGLLLRALPHRANSGGADPARTCAGNPAGPAGPGARAGDNMRWLSRIAWSMGDRPRAADLADRAWHDSSQGPACRELAYALSNRSMIAMLAGKISRKLWTHGPRAL